MSKNSTKRQQRIHYRVIKSYTSYENRLHLNNGKRPFFIVEVCTVFVPFKIGYFQSALTIRHLSHNHFLSIHDVDVSFLRERGSFLFEICPFPLGDTANYSLACSGDTANLWLANWWCPFLIILPHFSLASQKKHLVNQRLTRCFW